MKPAEILEWLPAFFCADMADNLEDSKKPFVIFLDTYESFVNELNSVGIASQKDEWLRGKNGPLQNIPKVLWVIAGREKLKWDNEEWGDSLDQHILGSLSETDAASFLTNAGISDKKLIDDIYKLTSGTPVFLDICVDRYFDCIDQGREPTIEEFGRDTSELIKRFALYMKDGMKDIFYMLSCLGSWSDELIDTIIDAGIIPNLSLTALEKANDFSFITESSDGIYTMHQVVADVLYKECCQNVTRIKERTLDTALDYCLEKLSVHSKYSSNYTALLESTIKLACRLYDNDDELGVFLEDKLGEFFDDIILSYHFDYIDRLLILCIVGIFALDCCFCRLVRNAQVTENNLREPVFSRFSVDTGNILYTAVELSIGIILKGRINQSRIKTELSSVRSDLEHIVDRRIYISCIDSIGSVGKLLNKLLLKRSSFDLDYLIITVRHIKFQRISGTNISDLLKHTHKFGQTNLKTLQRKWRR